MTDPANTPILRPTYAGIGARSTPPEVLADMTRIARWLHRTGWHLHSGGAHGADRAFADGATPETRTLYLPWPGYNGHAGPDCRTLSPAERTACERLAARTAPGLAAVFPGRPGAACPQCRHRARSGAEPSGPRGDLLDARRRDRRRHRHGHAHGGPCRRARAEPGRGFAPRRLRLSPQPRPDPRASRGASRASPLKGEGE